MKPGPPPKDAAKRQRHGRARTLISGDALLSVDAVPDPPAGLGSEVAGRWWDLWASDLAPLLRTTDLPALKRLFELYEDREQVRAEMRPKRKATPPKQRAGEAHNDFEHRRAVYRREQAMTRWVVYDDRGGVKVNPLVRLVGDLEAQIVALEDRFALSPTARAKLGLSQLRARTLAESNEATMAEATTDESDPRHVLRLDQAKSRRKPARPKGTSS